MNKDKFNSRLVETWLDGGASEAEAASLGDWLSSDPSRLREFAEAAYFEQALRARFHEPPDGFAAAAAAASNARPSEHLSPKESVPRPIACEAPAATPAEGAGWRRRTFRWRLAWGLGAVFALIGAAAFALSQRNPGVMPVVMASAEEPVWLSIHPPLTLRQRVAAPLLGFQNSFAASLAAIIAGSPASPGGISEITPGTLLRTSEGGGKLGYTNENTMVHLHAHTSLKVHAARRGKRFELISGAVSIHAAPQPKGEPIQILTANGTVSVMGTGLTLSAGGRSTRVRVDAGSVRLDSADGKGSIAVEAGQMAVARKDGLSPATTLTAINRHFGSGHVVRQHWGGVASSRVREWVDGGGLEKPADGEQRLEALESPPATGSGMDHYGARVRGFIHPPVSGEYTFWISADDTAQLWLGEGSGSETKRLLCEVDQWNQGFRNWWQYPSQESGPILLEAGKRYFFELLHKEGGGADFVSAAWQPPGADIGVIQGADLSPWQAPADPGE